MMKKQKLKNRWIAYLLIFSAVVSALSQQPLTAAAAAGDEEEAQAIYSSDGKHIWHEESLYLIPVGGYDTVRLEEIDEYEYEQLKVLNMKTPEEIIDAYTAMLLNDGVI